MPRLTRFIVLALLTAGCQGKRNAPAADSGTAGPPCQPEAEHRGEATYYTFANGTGNCSFDATPNDPLVAALNTTDYAGSSACGACAEVAGPNGKVTVRIVDRCPGCARGHLDLSPGAFERIAERSAGRVPISWRYVTCPVSGPLAYSFKEGSSPHWVGVQVRNHRSRIARFEYEKQGSFVPVKRESYNYFVEPDGMGPGPYTFRMTDVHGAVVIERGVPLRERGSTPGQEQFPACNPNGAPDR